MFFLCLLKKQCACVVSSCSFLLRRMRSNVPRDPVGNFVWVWLKIKQEGQTAGFGLFLWKSKLVEAELESAEPVSQAPFSALRF